MYRTPLLISLLVLSGLHTYGFGAATGSVQEPDAEILGFERESDFAKIVSERSTYRQSETISMLGSHSLQWDWHSGGHL
ncbi:MAG: hypothetical protein ABF315_02195, partial [Lentimonas sp.]